MRIEYHPSTKDTDQLTSLLDENRKGKIRSCLRTYILLVLEYNRKSRHHLSKATLSQSYMRNTSSDRQWQLNAAGRMAHFRHRHSTIMLILATGNLTSMT